MKKLMSMIMGFLLCASIHATNFSPFPATGAALDADTMKAGDVVFDSTNKTLRVGDGATLGGISLAKTTGTAPVATQALSVKSPATTGVVTITGPATGTTRVKTVSDANDTILELGGSYTPTGTWTSLTLVTPALGTPASGTLTNCTFPTLNQSTTGTATYATNLKGGNSTTLLGSMPYQSDTDSSTLLTPNTTATKKYLTQTGDGTNGAIPGWDTIAAIDVPTLNQNTSGSSASCTGNAATVTTNANLTGIVTSTGNATSIASGAITADKLQAAATDLGTANVTINLGNSNGAFVTDLTTNGTITASAGFTGNVSGSAGTVAGLTFVSGKSLTVNNIMTLAAGADSQTYTMPSTSKTLMASDMSNSSIPICTSVDTEATTDTPTANAYINLTVGGNTYKVLVETP